MFHIFHFFTETLTSFKSTKIEFKLGEEFDEFTADGRDCKTIATVEGRKLIKVRIYSFVQLINSSSRSRPQTRARATTPPGR